MDILLGVILFAVVVLPIVVIPHELGHMVAAKFCGMSVPAFSLGFGTILWRKQWRGTEYRLSLIPLGGYAKIPECSLSKKSAHPRWQRTLVLVAGPLANVVCATLLFVATPLIGISVPMVVTDVTASSPAGEAGLQPGEIIRSIDGRPIDEGFARELDAYAQRRIGKTLSMKVFSEEKITEREVVIKIPASGPLGFRYSPPFHYQATSTAEAINAGGEQLDAVLKGTVDAIYGMFRTEKSGEPAVMRPKVVGPLGILRIIPFAVREGTAIFLLFLAQLHLSLAAVNLLPLSALDGGQLTIITLEGIARRDFSQRTRETIVKAGSVVLLLLLLYVLFLDISRLGGWLEKPAS